MITINGRKISKSNSPYIIAEISANHNGSLEKAKELLLSAKKNNADAVKIQTYSADTMTIKSDKEEFLIKGGLWDGYSLYDLYKEAQTPFEWHKELFAYAKSIGLTIFSSPFDETAVDLLEDLKTPAYKIASFELCDIPLIQYIASKNKPILISTGMASKEEIEEAIQAARTHGCNEILLFHCISSYPTNIEEANLNNILNMRKDFNVEIGLSDHTLGNTAAIAAIALGASAIEKHFTISRLDKSPDSEFSMEPEELNSLVESTNDCWRALGKIDFIRSKTEIANKKFRRSIYFVKDLKKGERIKAQDIRRIRPGYGLQPKYFHEIIGRKVLWDVERGDPVRWNKIEPNNNN